MHRNHELILATDLDGTFLEGDHETKAIIYNQLIRLRERILLIYVTGRPIEIVKQFCDQGYLPHPHFVIGDHGTHVVDGNHFQPIEQLQKPIIERWNNGSHLIRTLLQNETGLQLQPLNPPYRVAYYYDEAQLQHETIEKIQRAGYDAILSCDLYLDIVPRGVNKGTTLLRLLKHLELDQKLAVTCGDSLNDLSLFETGLNSIAVGNSEPKLKEKIQTLENVYHSQFPGLLGIMDGLQFYEKIHLLDLNIAA